MEARQFKLMIPPDVKAWIAAEAACNIRSQSAQIVFVLRSVMAAGGDLGGTAPAAGDDNAA